MPFEGLVQVCKAEGVLSCIDAAHCVGMLDPDDLNLSKLDPDFFFSNCHKYEPQPSTAFRMLTYITTRWLFVPRGCAVFYVPKRNQRLIRSSLPTSHGFVAVLKPGTPAITNPPPPANTNPFVEKFAFVATVDTSPYASVPAAIDYRRTLGGERAIAAYLVDLARRGGRAAKDVLGTDVLENEEGTLGKCAFANVRLPLDADELLVLVHGRRVPEAAEEAATAKAQLRNALVQWMPRVIARDYDTFMSLFWYGGNWWVRLSAQVYLEVSDFEWAGRILLKVCERAKKGEFLEGTEVSKF